ncbi:EAL domain-containing protein [Aliiglaciecola sp. 3_MG-2023]|uniref:sensor domain-containing protein n=1 Tax=Aliiglaciecola sp. 3_MG-2023 TaxID=3062644 RepID=UPI0026E2606B|nr:EAL domain-containing protein [Aliiglaciecola sp. 3_MG-2023]MDO6691979.1 EAL domain-containing protein [Aliiglaciecola sp. 3_MG-2023]
MLLENELLLEIIEQLPIAVFAKDPNDNYRFVIWNKKMASLFENPRENVIGTSDFDFFNDIEEAKKFRQIDEDVMAQGKVIDIQEEVTTSHGVITCHTLKLPLVLADGRKLLVGIIDDITEETANKKQLYEYSHKLESLVEKRTLQLQDLANRDSLTGLGNRSFLLTEIKSAIKDRPLSDEFAIIFIDLNGFKLINDSYGHRLGDDLLRLVGQRLESFRNQAPVIARLGGDEFVLTVNTGDTSALKVFAESLKDVLSAPFLIRNHSFEISCAVGISIWPHNGREATFLLQTADMAMYNVKHSKVKNKHYQFYDEKMLALSQRKFELQQSLRKAIANDEMYLVLQPQFRLDEHNSMSGAEVLLRWKSEKFGNVSPSEFIPIAEKSGLMVDINAWILERSCCLIKQLHDEFSHLPRISINLSGDEISVGLAKRLNKQLEQYQLPAKTLTLEITEAQLVNFSEAVLLELEQLRHQGIRISLDDFGTGYSAMSYLSSLEFDEIKIDRSFVCKIVNDKKTALLARAMVSMAHALESDVVAEGVETQEQLTMLKGMRVDIVQGYLLGKPMSYQELCSHISSGKFPLSESL